MNGDGSIARAVRGPAMLITVGVLFALNNFTPYGFSETWPALLIVFGLLSLLGRGSRAPQPPYGYPQNAYPPPPQARPPEPPKPPYSGGTQ